MEYTTGRPPSCTCGECKKCKHAAYMRKWYQRLTPEQKAAWIANRDPESQKRSDRRRAQTERRKASAKAAATRKRNDRPDEATAHMRLSSAIARGELVRQPCTACGEAKTDGHHYLGYAPEHWLHVIWLCRKHHAEAHRLMRVVM